MRKPYSPYIPQGRSEIMDKLASMMLSNPPFEDDSGYFPGKNLDTEFLALNEGLRLIRKRLGEARYLELKDMSDRMHGLFESSPVGDSDELDAGREILLDMRELLIRKG